ncbi:MAG TPA: hypothetical protein VMX94_04095 [Armatimonadota bacterium]|nr:hypothetical protein [Armatimonadota bacterium]
MGSVKAWLEDRKNLPIVAAGTGVIIIVVVLVFLKMTGKIGGGGQPAGTIVPPYPSPTGAMPTAPGAPTVPPGVVPGVGGPPAAPAMAKQPPMLPYRKDPFEPFTGPLNRAHMLEYYMPNVRRERLAPAAVFAPKVEVEEVLPPQPVRRMAGVMWNGKIAAILETNGQADIVRPGMIVTRGGSRVMVDSIQPNSIILKTLDTRTPMTIKVNMAGAVTAGQGGYVPPPGSPVSPAGPVPPGAMSW